MNRIYQLLVLALLIGLTGCASLGEDETLGWSERQLYDAAQEEMADKSYDVAIKHLENLEARYPFGPYAKQAQLEVAYAYYKYNESDSAIAAANRFMRMNPSHPHVDYAIYLKGLINFNRGGDFLEKYMTQNPADLDPGSTRQAFVDFQLLTTKYPQSRYAPDARQRMVYLRNNLAIHEVNTADYNLRRGAYVAAANRATEVVTSFSGAPAVGDALALLSRAYIKLEIRDLAADALKVLIQNFPEHPQIKVLQTELGVEVNKQNQRS
jgi:outer membrane protein assembly factor BamD